MVLSGTLREFILADVMQLLTQQKITGKLVLINNRAEGTIIFKNGNIVGASKETETFSIKLSYYLTTILGNPRNKVRELFSSYEGRVAELTEYLIKKNILNANELENYAITVTTDIACSLFLWTSGNYHFDSIKSVDHLIPANIDIPVENVVMEAMRRIDEWHRMREAITEETIFVHTDKPIEFPDQYNVLDDPLPYYYQQINGTQAVKIFLENAFQTEYKVYECLYSLLQSEHIRPLSDRLSHSIQAAIDRNKRNTIIIPPVLAAGITVGTILVVILIAWLYRNVLFQNLTLASNTYKYKNSIIIAEYHEKDAYRFLQYNSIDEIPESELTAYSSITDRDTRFLQLRNALISEKQKNEQ